MSAPDDAKPLTSKDRRQQRLAQELRSNLRRRKGVPLATSPSEPADGPAHATTPDPEAHDKRA